MTVNSKLQVRLLEGTEVKARPSQEIKELRTEIHHIGNNINQIARSVNLGIARAEDAKRGLFHNMERPIFVCVPGIAQF